MTEKQKKVAIIAFIAVIALFLLLRGKSAGGNTIINNETGEPIQVSIPGIDMPPRSPFIVNVPGLPSFTPYQYSAVSPCMCNGAATTPTSYSERSNITFVSNAPNTPTNIYNYYAPAPVSQPRYSGGFTAYSR